MTFEEALNKSIELNESGLHKKEWFYYPAYYEGIQEKYKGSCFVMRRQKETKVHIAVYGDGTPSVLESNEW